MKAQQIRGDLKQPQVQATYEHQRQQFNTRKTCNENRCFQCGTFRNCMVRKPGVSALNKLTGLIRHLKPLRKGQVLVRQGQQYSAAYIVQSGSLKSTVFMEDGECWVSGFHFPGELVALDGMESGKYQSELCALETTSVCVLPSNFFRSLSETHRIEVCEDVVKALIGTLSQQARNWQTLVGVPAKKRLVNFILHISERMQACGKSAEDLDLNMTRCDMANHLGLAQETVSRLIHRMQSDGLIATHRSQVKILDMNGLRAINHCDEERKLA